MKSLERQLLEYGAFHELQQGRLSLDVLAGIEVPETPTQVRNLRPWLVVAASAAVVLVLIGGLGLLTRLFDNATPPIVDEAGAVADTTFRAVMSEPGVFEVSLAFMPDLFDPAEMSTARLRARVYDAAFGRWCQIEGGVDTPGEWINDGSSLTIDYVDRETPMFCDDGTRQTVRVRATWAFSLAPAGAYTSSKQGSDCTGEQSSDFSPLMSFETTASVTVELLEPSQGEYLEQNGTCHPIPGESAHDD